MNEVAERIASQIIPLNGERIVLPNTAVAEIIDYTQPDGLPSSIKDAPDWLLGMLAWRGLSVPLISYERMIGGSFDAPDTRARIAVINSVGAVAGSPFFAIVSQGIPQLMHIDADKISIVDDSTETSSVIACHAVISGEVVIIPDVDEVEKMLANALSGKGAASKKDASKNSDSKKKSKGNKKTGKK